MSQKCGDILVWISLICYSWNELFVVLGLIDISWYFYLIGIFFVFAALVIVVYELLKPLNRISQLIKLSKYIFVTRGHKDWAFILSLSVVIFCRIYHNNNDSHTTWETEFFYVCLCLILMMFDSSESMISIVTPVAASIYVVFISISSIYECWNDMENIKTQQILKKGYVWRDPPGGHCIENSNWCEKPTRDLTLEEIHIFFAAEIIIELVWKICRYKYHDINMLRDNIFKKYDKEKRFYQQRGALHFENDFTLHVGMMIIFAFFQLSLTVYSTVQNVDKMVNLSLTAAVAVIFFTILFRIRFCAKHLNFIHIGTGRKKDFWKLNLILSMGIVLCCTLDDVIKKIKENKDISIEIACFISATVYCGGITFIFFLNGIEYMKKYFGTSKMLKCCKLTVKLNWFRVLAFCLGSIIVIAGFFIAGHTMFCWFGQDKKYKTALRLALLQIIRMSIFMLYFHYDAEYGIIQPWEIEPEVFSINSLLGSNNRYEPPAIHDIDVEYQSSVTDAELIQIKNKLMNKLVKYEEETNLNNVNELLHYYYDLLQHWKDIEKIMTENDRCHVAECHMFQCNYRNRSKCAAKSNKDEAMKQIVSKIHCLCRHPFDIEQENDRMNKKYYGQLYKKQYDEDNKFIFGQEFRYIDKDDIKKQYDEDNKCIYIRAKHGNMKEELTSNSIATMNIHQFDNEYCKAKWHFDSYTRKRQQHLQNLELEHLLALMVYCNFDDLQCEFSKTYRESVRDHCNFYYLGKRLKQSVLEHGQCINNGNISTFYHGVSAKLVPAQIVGDLGEGICIYCAVSTSGSEAVAISFSKHNQGLVMTFSGNQSEAKYFHTAWLSDYAHEDEYLFLQNKQALQITNIKDCTTAVQYAKVLNALKAMDSIFPESHHYKGNSIEKQSELMKSIVQIIECRSLSNLSDIYDTYAVKLINVYFENKKQLTINYPILKQKYLGLFELICLKEYQWIRMQELNAIFPNIKDIEIVNIKLCSKVMNDIATNGKIFHGENNSWKLNRMKINAKKTSQLRVSEAIISFEKTFKCNKFSIYMKEINEDSKYDILEIKDKSYDKNIDLHSV
eukprot:172135_1